MPQNSDDEVEVLVQAGYATSTDAAIDALKNQKLRRLLDETSDFVESDDFYKVLRNCLEELFAIFCYL
ncbi:peroxin [Umbelopsis sp. WA50703]